MNCLSKYLIQIYISKLTSKLSRKQPSQIVLARPWSDSYINKDLIVQTTIIIFNSLKYFLESGPLRLRLHGHEVPLVLNLLLPRSPHHLVFFHLLLRFHRFLPSPLPLRFLLFEDIKCLKNSNNLYWKCYYINALFSIAWELLKFYQGIVLILTKLLRTIGC